MQTKTRRHYFFLLAAVLIVTTSLSGCMEEPKEESILTPAGRSVTKDGVELSFEEGFPPSAVKASTEFDVYINIRNKGSYDVLAGEFELNLIPSNFESKLDDELGGEHSWSEVIPGWTNEELMAGVSEFGVGDDFLIGSEVFGVFKYSGLSKGTSKKEDITAKACYYYETNASGQICLKPNPDEESPVCSEEGDPKHGKLQVLSSGPIHVTSVKEKLTADSVELEINVEHVGKGDPYKPYKPDCADKQNDKNYVFLKSLSVGVGKGKEDYTFNCCQSKEDPVKCKNERTRRLSEGKTTFKCEIIKPVQMVTTEQFELTLAYKYSTSVKTEVTVKI